MAVRMRVRPDVGGGYGATLSGEPGVQGPEAPFSSAALDSAFAPIGFRAYSAP